MMLKEYSRIVIYEYGKVGTNTIVNSFRNYLNEYDCGWHFQIKKEYPEYIIVTHQHDVFEDIINKNNFQKILIITATRNCLSFGMSLFFELILQKYSKEEVINMEKYELLENCKKFISLHANKDDWFDGFYKNTGINILDDYKENFLFKTNDIFDVLMYRFEDIQNLKNIIKETLNIDLNIARGNLSENKWYANEYKYCKDNIIITKDILSSYYNSNHHKKIYSDKNYIDFKIEL
jgi:hypothetical protein